MTALPSPLAIRTDAERESGTERRHDSHPTVVPRAVCRSVPASAIARRATSYSGV
ncbi:MAG: hypothetical protein IT458_00780 [Planctomycetes bacterium]|nr:hypothetical protein [Planctomycetota bacterium]